MPQPGGERRSSHVLVRALGNRVPRWVCDIPRVSSSLVHTAGGRKSSARLPARIRSEHTGQSDGEISICRQWRSEREPKWRRSPHVRPGIDCYFMEELDHVAAL